jgi:hypothetical protein
MGYYSQADKYYDDLKSPWNQCHGHEIGIKNEDGKQTIRKCGAAFGFQLVT